MDPCPDCGHHNVMVMDTAGEINDYNQQIEDNNKTLTSQYNCRTVTDTEKANTKKTRMKKKAQSFACYCCKKSCLNQMNEGNCELCREGNLFNQIYGHTTCMCAVYK